MEIFARDKSEQMAWENQWLRPKLADPLICLKPKGKEGLSSACVAPAESGCVSLQRKTGQTC